MDCIHYNEQTGASYMCHHKLIYDYIFLWLHLQIEDDDDDDGQLSSSEGSTVDFGEAGDGRESLDFELNDSLDPDPCFPAGEYYCNYCCHLTFYSFGVNLMLHF